jgi:hypothetical protein
MAALVASALLSSPSYAASSASPASFAALGTEFIPDGHPGQCGGPFQQWVAAGFWSTPIRIDADGRTGGCLLAFGVQDANVGFTYRWVSSGGNAAQCGNPGLYVAPETTPATFGSRIRINTDNRAGGCYLTLALDSASWLVDVFYFTDGNAGQCGGTATAATVSSTRPVQLLVDTDERTGGCNLQLRLRSV